MKTQNVLVIDAEQAQELLAAEHALLEHLNELEEDGDGVGTEGMQPLFDLFRAAHCFVISTRNVEELVARQRLEWEQWEDGSKHREQARVVEVQSMRGEVEATVTVTPGAVAYAKVSVGLLSYEGRVLPDREGDASLWTTGTLSVCPRGVVEKLRVIDLSTERTIGLTVFGGEAR